MATGGKQRDERDRARLYQARRTFHEGRARRRTRDNVIAGVGGGILILAVIAGQTAYFVAGPGAPTPEPTTSSTPEPTTSTTPDLAPTAEPTVPPELTPAPTP